MGKPNVVGAIATLALGFAVIGSSFGLMRAAYEHAHGVPRYEAIKRFERLEEIGPLTYRLASPGFYIGLKLVYRD